MQRGSWSRNGALFAIQAAARQDVITAHALVDCGVPESTVYARCRPGGPWQLLAPATVLLSTGHPTEEQMIIAALLYGGPDTVVTGLHACRRLGVQRGPAPGTDVHVLVPHERHIRSVPRIVVERTRRMPAPLNRGGIPVAPSGRAAADASRRIRSPRDVTELFADTVQRGLTTVAILSTEIEAAQRRGTAIPRAVLADVSAGARSAAERDARSLWRRTGLPEPWWNVEVYADDGTFLGVADAWWDEIAFAWEINSVAWHLSPADYAREQAREARFGAAGVPMLPTLAGRFRTEPDRVMGELIAAYGEAARRPRASVHAIGPTGTGQH